MQGIIKTFASEKGYGFIRGDDAKDYFFHIDSFRSEDKARIGDDMPVVFEQKATPKGYRAENCALLSVSGITRYVVPEDFLTSKLSTVKGWEIVEIGHWIVYGSSRDSPDAARRNLIDGAMAVRANALIDVEYFKSTGQEAGTGKGTHHFTIHNFRGRIVTVAKRSHKGTLLLDDLRGLNDRAETAKRKMIDLCKTSKAKALRVNTIVGLVFLSGVGLIYIFSNKLGAMSLVPIVLMVIGAGFFICTGHDDGPWLQRAPYEN